MRREAAKAPWRKDTSTLTKANIYGHRPPKGSLEGDLVGVYIGTYIDKDRCVETPYLPTYRTEPTTTFKFYLY